jgi:hypothetical protein
MGKAVPGKNLTSRLPPIPAVANYAETQAIEPGEPFTPRWNSFAGAGSQDLIWVRIESSESMVLSTPVPGAEQGADESSFISLEILDGEGDSVFPAPNECTDLEFAPTAPSIVIPAGTLAPGRVYELSLGFFRITDTREHGASEITFIAAQGANTTTTLSTVGGGVSQDFRFSEARFDASGRFQATVTGTPGTFIAVEWTDNWVDGRW